MIRAALFLGPIEALPVCTMLRFSHPTIPALCWAHFCSQTLQLPLWWGRNVHCYMIGETEAWWKGEGPWTARPRLCGKHIVELQATLRSFGPSHVLGLGYNGRWPLWKCDPYSGLCESRCSLQISGVVFLLVKKADRNVACDCTEVGRIFLTKNKIKKKEECFVRGSGCPLASNLPPPLSCFF